MKMNNCFYQTCNAYTMSAIRASAMAME
jgi:hypothetical protein